MTEPRDPDQIDPETQSYTPAPADVPGTPSAGVSYGRPSTYSPPQESRTPWSAQQWQQQTPQHWLEPLPGQDRRRRRRSRSGLYLTMAIVVALVAGAIGSAVTYMALAYNGNLAASNVAIASPSPTPQPVSSSQTVIVDDQTAITTAAEAVSPAVVTITVREGEATDPFSLPQTGVGSGIIYDPNGWVLTNRHVVADATQVTVELQDGRRLPATVYGIDTLTDLAIVKIDATGLPAARIGDSSTLKPGQTAIVIGSPLGQFTNSVTSGVISALSRQLVVSDPVTGERRQLRNLVQTDAAINPGNSGGPLVDAAGNVVGVSTAFAESAQGIFFAIPINIAKPIMRQAVAGEPLSRPWIGVVYVPLNRSLADQNKLPIDYGAWVSPDTADGKPPIIADSPAATAGLKANDIITAINGIRIDTSQGLDDILSAFSPGDRLTLSVLRDGQTLSMGLTLGTRPAGLE
jgi:serine protease Do